MTDTSIRIRTLLREARLARDYSMARLCERALEGDEEARDACVEVIREARARAEADEADDLGQ